jgi:FkbM family methyltransferase
MRKWKKIVIDLFAKRDIYISRKYHPNDGTITKRISQEMINQGGGVLHIGAHEGQEAEFYFECGVPVIWIEALPQKVEFLVRKLSAFPNQEAHLALLGDSNVHDVEFNISDNNAASSSLFMPQSSLNLPFKMTNTILLQMKRLDGIFDAEKLSGFKHWVIDVQGAELKVLQGAGALLEFCNSLVIEAKRFSNYLDGCTWDEIVVFLKGKGFIPLWQIGENDEDNAFFLRVENRI